MLTQYGKLAIEVDPRTGRAKMLPGSRPSADNVCGRADSAMRQSRPPKTPRQSRVHTVERTMKSSSAESRPPAVHGADYDSQLEADRHRYWGLQQLCGGDIAGVIHHPFTLHLTPELDYTPDLLILFNDGRVQVEETKGHLKMKNARDSITRLKMAADRFPTWTWILVTGPRTRWTERYIGGRRPDPITNHQPRRPR